MVHIELRFVCSFNNFKSTVVLLFINRVIPIVILITPQLDALKALSASLSALNKISYELLFHSKLLIDCIYYFHALSANLFRNLMVTDLDQCLRFHRNVLNNHK